MPITAQQIQLARKSGYSDDEIVSHLAQTEPQMKTAVGAGYSPSEIMAHFTENSPSDRTAQVAKGAAMTSAEASQYAANRAAFAEEGGASVFGGNAAPTDTRRVSYSDSASGAKQSLGSIAKSARPVLEGGGVMVGSALGGLLGASAGAVTVPGVGAIPGAGIGAAMGGTMGYQAGQSLADLVTGTPMSLKRGIEGLKTGAEFEAYGQAAGPVIAGASKVVGAVAKPLLGRLAGTGTGAVEEALASGMAPTRGWNPLKSSTTYDNALRGKISGEDTVDMARTALGRLKDARATEYQGQLQQIAQNGTPIDHRPIKAEVSGLMQKYNVKIDPTSGALDTSRMAMGKAGRKDIEEIIQEVSSYGTQPGDNTALGLDALKRRLDDFYSDSSQARQFVAQIRNKVKGTIVANVPQYEEMTKGYTDATKIIKDVEAGLMLRKQGMSGRIVADQTLRRLMSSMKDNFALRKELVSILGKEGGEDLGQAIAGYAHSSVLPVGLAGTGPALVGSVALTKLVDPSFGALLAASSPRIQGEFLRMWGKGMKGAKVLGATGAKNVTRQLLISASDKDDQE